MKKISVTIVAVCFFAINTFAQLNFKAIKPGTQPCTTPLADMMFKAVDTVKGRSVANNYLAWENGEVILVKFMNNAGSKSIRSKIMQYAKEWEQFGNIIFKFVADTAAFTNIRVQLGSFLDEIGHNSKLGISCNEIPQRQQTLNLDTSDFIDFDAYVAEFTKGGAFTQYIKNKVSDFNTYTDRQFRLDVLAYPEVDKKWNLGIVGRKSRHEFGHSLGLLHEQSYPGKIQWNLDTVYKHYAKLGWNKEVVDFNVIETSDQFFTNGTAYDPQSVMHYDVHSWQTVDGYSLKSSYIISDGDKKLIAALYPKNKKISALAVPKIQVLNFTKLDVKTDNIRKGLVIQPSFDLRTSAILGTVHFVALLTTEDGKTFFPSTNERFSWGKSAASYLPVNLLPSTKLSYNKAIKKNLELFFPFKEMPPLNGAKVKVMFVVYQFDPRDKKFDKVAAATLSSAPMDIPR